MIGEATGWLWVIGASEQLLVLLVAGHLLGDFALQSARMASGKKTRGVLFAHVALVTVAHLLALLPLLSLPVAIAAVVIGLLHGVIDWVKAQLQQDGEKLGPFLVDQAAHLAVVLGAWGVLVHIQETPAIGGLWELHMAVVILAAVVAFNAVGGGAIVKAILASCEFAATVDSNHCRDDDTASGMRGSGALIGVLERTLSLLLILVGQWAAIAILIAAKSIARFDDLKDRAFAEYYLIGTLASLLVVVVVGIATTWLFGFR
jgi:hypothetical protein